MAKRYVTGESKLRRTLRRFPDQTKEELKLAVREGAEELRLEISLRAPKDKGDLAEAAHAVVSRDGLAAKIGYSSGAGFRRQFKRGGFTAGWQEFGTKNHPAQPFIRPAFRRKVESVLNRIDAAVKTTLRRASIGQF